MQLDASKMWKTMTRVLDQILKVEKLIAIRHKVERARTVHAGPSSKLSRLAPRNYLRCDPEAIVHIDWSGEAGGID
jgi:hypothetical protein